MSKNFKNNKEFLHLLLNSSKDQSVALLLTATKEQLKLLNEIFINLLQLPLPTRAKRHLNSKVLNNIVKSSDDKKRALLKKHYRILLLLLWSVKSELEQIQQ